MKISNDEFSQTMLCSNTSGHTYNYICSLLYEGKFKQTILVSFFTGLTNISTSFITAIIIILPLKVLYQMSKQALFLSKPLQVEHFCLQTELFLKKHQMVLCIHHTSIFY